MKVYRCKRCGRIIEEIKEGAGIPICCGEEMTHLVPGSSDGAYEKHVPVVKTNGNEVAINVGSVDHPMIDVHYIEWIALETNRGIYRKPLKPGEKPERKFILMDDEEVVAVYAYCNLHGLWKA